MNCSITTFSFARVIQLKASTFLGVGEIVNERARRAWLLARFLISLAQLSNTSVMYKVQFSVAFVFSCILEMSSIHFSVMTVGGMLHWT